MSDYGHINNHVPAGPIYLVSHRQPHHASHSGYDRLTHYLGETIEAQPLSARLVRSRILTRLADGVIAYDRKSLATELKTSIRMASTRNGVFHVLYGENTYRHLGRLNGFRGNRVVATFHLPSGALQRAVRVTRHLRQLSAVVCVGRSQLRVLEEIVGHKRVFYVPHGVDTEYFQPPESGESRSNEMCLFVGAFLRDLPTLRAVIELVSLERPRIRFIAVTSEEAAEGVGSHPNLVFRTGIDEKELLDLYQRASVLVMPLRDATANNAVLEAMACGLPIVVTDVGSIRDYVVEDGAALTPPNDARLMARQIISVLDQPRRRRVMELVNRQRALSFAWPLVAVRLREVYAPAALAACGKSPA